MLDSRRPDNKQVIREEDFEKANSGGSSKADIYNSETDRKNNFLNKDFLRFFRLPLVVIVFLAAVALVLKFLFFHKSEPVKMKKIVKKNTAISYKKRFSPSVFSYASKTGVRSDKFKIKFKKETEKLNGKIKYKGGETAPEKINPPQITEKMVVFIKASYGRNILRQERGAKPAGQNKNIIGADAANKPVSGNTAAVVIRRGTVLNAYTKYKIFSYNTAVPVIAILANAYIYRGKKVFKKGDKFFGTVSVKHSLNRLNINFSKIIEISGKSMNIDAIAMMPDGSGGVKGDVHRHYTGNIIASIAQGVASAASIFAGGGSGVNSSNPYTFQNQIRENVARNELGSAQNGINNYANSNQNISITLPAGTQIKIIFLKPLYEN